MPTGPRTIDARVVKALGHPTRVRILAVLRERELASPVELSDELGVPLGTISYHVRRLETLGLIELATRTQRRGAVEHHYRAREALDAPLPRPTQGRVRETTAAASRALADALRMLPRGGFDTFAARVDQRTVALDEEGRAELDAEQVRWLGEIARIERDSAERIAADGAGQGRIWTVVAMVFDTDGVDDADAS
jgi:DNA-binding transcriptional ArsR family regulator